MERRWELIVRDGRGRRRKGVVVWMDRPPRRLEPPAPPEEFSIVVVSAPLHPASIPDATAVCIAGAPDIRLVGRPTPVELPQRLEALRVLPSQMDRFACGRILTRAPIAISPRDVFAVEAMRPQFDRLALALLAVVDAEEIAPYVELIRSVLKLHPQEDALAVLEIRLSPADPGERPPARAPAIRRLRAALKTLRQGMQPELTLDAMAEDLRFLRLFADDDEWSRDGLARLLKDIREPGRTPAREGSAHQSKILPWRGDKPEAEER